MFSEQSITDRLRTRTRFPAGSPVIAGIGDDCAIYRPRGSADDLLFTTDLSIEGVHFTHDTHKPADVAYIAVARSVSDIAAMGGSPRFTLASVSLSAVDALPNAFFDALARFAQDFGAPLAGGDLARSDRTFCDITVCGAVPRGMALRRNGARAGHEIYVSGLLGGSALGLEARQSEVQDSKARNSKAQDSKAQNSKAWKRHIRPEPRLELGEFLRARLRATACMDLSDGLSLDLQRICLASGVAAEIADPPRFPGASIEQALHGGEDYELLFTVRPGTRVPARFNRLPLTRIGTIIEGSPGEVRWNGRRLDPLGYDHFRHDRLARR
jgi:thiamine-monophosphate kinase